MMCKMYLIFLLRALFLALMLHDIHLGNLLLSLKGKAATLEH